ncbi:hypothetical protein BS78_09G036800 [Paspalum vaginatum]|nr:hypothetical protein BS78_09G036800 [Paspalum vaginatum]
MDKAARKAAFRKRRATLLEKAHELSVLCSVPVAVVVFGGPDEAEAQPTVWPAIPEATEILQRYSKLPDNSKGAHKLDKEGFMHQRKEKLQKKVENYKTRNRELEVNLVLNDISLGRRHGLDDLSPELVTSVRSLLDAVRHIVRDRVSLLRSEGGAAAAAAAVPEPVVAASQQEAPIMVPPLAMVPTVENTALAQPPSSLESWLLDPEPPAVAPVASLLPPAPLVEPHATDAVGGVGLDEPFDLYGEPRDGSFLLEMADAIMDDGTGRIQATAEDVDRLLREHGLEQFIKPK